MSGHVHALNAKAGRFEATWSLDECPNRLFCATGNEPFNPRHMMPRCGEACCPEHRGDFPRWRYRREQRTECLGTAWFVAVRSAKGGGLIYPGEPLARLVGVEVCGRVP